MKLQNFLKQLISASQKIGSLDDSLDEKTWNLMKHSEYDQYNPEDF